MVGSSTGSIFKAVLLWRFINIAALYGIYRLSSIFLKRKDRLLFVFNPLVLVESIGNVHFEILAVFSLISSLYLIKAKYHYISGVWFGIAIGIKLIPVFLIGIFLLHLSKFKKWFPFAMGVFSILLFIGTWFNLKTLLNLFQSIKLYYSVFEFNASVYYLLRLLLSPLYGYNPIHIISPALGIAFGALTAWYTFHYLRSDRSDEALTFKMGQIFALYFIFASIVHPWYIILVLPWILSSYRNTALLWSFVIFLSYSHYYEAEYRERWIILILEYGFLLCMWIYEKRAIALSNRPSQ